MGPLRTGSPLSPPVATADLAKSHIKAHPLNTLFRKTIINCSMLLNFKEIVPWFFRTSDMIQGTPGNKYLCVWHQGDIQYAAMSRSTCHMQVGEINESGRSLWSQ